MKKMSIFLSTFLGLLVFVFTVAGQGENSKNFKSSSESLKARLEDPSTPEDLKEAIRATLKCTNEGELELKKKLAESEEHRKKAKIMLARRIKEREQISQGNREAIDTVKKRLEEIVAKEKPSSDELDELTLLRDMKDHSEYYLFLKELFLKARTTEAKFDIVIELIMMTLTIKAPNQGQYSFILKCIKEVVDKGLNGSQCFVLANILTYDKRKTAKYPEFYFFAMKLFADVYLKNNFELARIENLEGIYKEKFIPTKAFHDILLNKFLALKNGMDESLESLYETERNTKNKRSLEKAQKKIKYIEKLPAPYISLGFRKNIYAMIQKYKSLFTKEELAEVERLNKELEKKASSTP